MKWIPKIVYKITNTNPLTGVTVPLSLPQRLWTPGSTGVGGTDTSAAGITESFLIRRDQTLDVRLVFREKEWPGVHAWLTWMQDTAGSCRFYPAASDLDFNTCYLESPRMGEEIRPERGEYPGTYEIGVRLRDASGTAFDVRAYDPKGAA